VAPQTYLSASRWNGYADRMKRYEELGGFIFVMMVLAIVIAATMWIMGW